MENKGERTSYVCHPIVRQASVISHAFVKFTVVVLNDTVAVVMWVTVKAKRLLSVSAVHAFPLSLHVYGLSMGKEVWPDLNTQCNG